MQGQSGNPRVRELRTLPQTVSERPFVSVRWLRRLIYQDRRLPSYKLGGRVLIDLIELDALIEGSRRDRPA
ncbi:MAG: hypothetical protein ACRD0U_19185 [Acidimicrobiales bacterium]